MTYVTELADLAVDMCFNDLEQQVVNDHLSALAVLDARIEAEATYLELGGTMESVWARLSKAKEME